MEAARLNLRMQKEIKLLMADPPSGVSFPFLSDKDNFFSSFLNIEARLTGPEETVYSGGLFTLKIQIPERYPFQPPNVTFVTPIYHPNIDNGGRICLDILNLPPKGGWKPSLNISTVMTSIGLLLSDPNPDDGLMAEASREYKYSRKVFDEKARDWTRRFADPFTATKNAEDDIQLTNLMMPMQGEEKPLRTLSMDPHPDKQGGDEAEESSKKKLRLTASKLSLSSTPSFRSISGEKSKEDKIAAAAAAEDHDNITNENFKAVEESPDIRTIIISDSEESDSEIAGSTLSLSNAAFCKR